MTDLLMNRDATYGHHDRLRWTLTREWAAGPQVCFIGHNPSTAGHETDDPTSLAWVRLATANGCGRYVAVNVFPFRSTDPKAAHHWADRAPSDHLRRNVEVILDAARESRYVVACWGALGAMVVDGPVTPKHIVNIVTGAGVDIHCLGTTQDGHPKHPLARGRHFVSRDQKFLLFAKKMEGPAP